MSADLHLDTQIHGQGSPLLMVHGFASSRFTWRHLVPVLAERHQTITVDLLGHGASPKPPDAQYSIANQARLLVDAIRRMDLHELTLVGHSYGGGVVLRTVMDLMDAGEDRLKRLVLVGTAAYMQDFPPFIGVLRRPFLGRLLPRLVPANVGAMRALRLAIHDHSRITPEQREGWAEPMRQRGIHEALRKIAVQILPANLDQLIARYPSIQTPTLLLWGKHDRVVPLEVGQRLDQALPNSQLTIIDDCGHIPHEELPEQAIDAIQSFLASD